MEIKTSSVTVVTEAVVWWSVVERIPNAINLGSRQIFVRLVSEYIFQ